ncbi:MAG TPA: molybdopterin-synthase adenylyltransferase MoeB [Kiloniellales bacterium]|jgi:molybdopterin/thiamine biosynthesis adenylyltransferase|nr:molybdopterin-synthase adenylyltransferase MoeB [Kiloniellales bacterium]
MEDFTDEQIERYARHLVLPEIGEEGQRRLMEARVLVIGAGGLGSPVLLYLAAAGVGTLGVIDDDQVDLSNLQRQIVHATADIGQQKVESARKRLKAINPEVGLEAHPLRLTTSNAHSIISSYDIVADGSDNFATRYLVADACHLAGRTLVSAAMMRFEGQLSVYRSHLGHGPDGTANPCWRCVYPEQPDGTMKNSCADVGVLAMLPGVLGTLQATEVVKEILGVGRSLAGRLLLYEGLEARFAEMRLKADPACALCGSEPTITSLEDGRYGGRVVACAAE